MTKLTSSWQQLYVRSGRIALPPALARACSRAGHGSELTAVGNVYVNRALRS